MAINSLRTGWNARGGTAREQLAAQEAAQRRVQEKQREAAYQCIVDEIGYDAFMEWFEANITNAMPISDVIAACRQYLDDLVTCTCRPDAGGLCPACLRYVERTATEELEF